MKLAKYAVDILWRIGFWALFFGLCLLALCLLEWAAQSWAGILIMAGLWAVLILAVESRTKK